MEGEQAPIAPAVEPQAAAPVASEATPTPTQTYSEAPAAPVANIPADQIEAFNKFVGANGGFEKAFAKLRNDVSNPAPERIRVNEHPEYQPRYQEQPRNQYDQYNQYQSQQQYMPEGYISQEEFQTQQYFNAIANEEAYAPIADQIRSGEVFKEMAKFGIRPSQNGMFNDGQVRSFLSLLAKTVPSQQTTTPLTTTPTVDYIATGEQIASRDEALAIINQNMSLRQRGIAEHPRTAEAKQFLRDSFKK